MMAVQRVGDMTLDELNTLIEEKIVHHLKKVTSERDDHRSMAEVNASIRRNRIVPPPGSKSALEMLREDRDA